MKKVYFGKAIFMETTQPEQVLPNSTILRKILLSGIIFISLLSYIAYRYYKESASPTITSINALIQSGDTRALDEAKKLLENKKKNSRISEEAMQALIIASFNESPGKSVDYIHDFLSRDDVSKSSRARVLTFIAENIASKKFSPFETKLLSGPLNKYLKTTEDGSIKHHEIAYYLYRDAVSTDASMSVGAPWMHLAYYEAARLKSALEKNEVSKERALEVFWYIDTYVQKADAFMYIKEDDNIRNGTPENIISDMKIKNPTYFLMYSLSSSLATSSKYSLDTVEESFKRAISFADAYATSSNHIMEEYTVGTRLYLTEMYCNIKGESNCTKNPLVETLGDDIARIVKLKNKGSLQHLLGKNSGLSNEYKEAIKVLGTKSLSLQDILIAEYGWGKEDFSN